MLIRLITFGFTFIAFYILNSSLLNANEKLVVIPIISSSPPAKVYTWQEDPSLIPEDGPDGDTLSAKIIIPPSAGIIADLNIYIFIKHTFNNDLDVSLVHKKGEQSLEVILFTDVGYNDHGFYVVLDDEASTNIGSIPDHPNDEPIIGSAKPENAELSNFDGRDASGEWTLTIDDDWRVDRGELISWSLNITED